MIFGISIHHCILRWRCVVIWYLLQNSDPSFVWHLLYIYLFVLNMMNDISYFNSCHNAYQFCVVAIAAAPAVVIFYHRVIHRTSSPTLVEFPIHSILIFASNHAMLWVDFIWSKVCVLRFALDSNEWKMKRKKNEKKIPHFSANNVPNITKIKFTNKVISLAVFEFFTR